MRCPGRASLLTRPCITDQQCPLVLCQRFKAIRVRVRGLVLAHMMVLLELQAVFFSFKVVVNNEVLKDTPNIPDLTSLLISEDLVIWEPSHHHQKSAVA